MWPCRAWATRWSAVTRRQSPARRLARDEALERPHPAPARVAAHHRVAHARHGHALRALDLRGHARGALGRRAQVLATLQQQRRHGRIGRRGRRHAARRHAGPVQAQPDLVGRGGREVEREEGGRADLRGTPPGFAEAVGQRCRGVPRQRGLLADGRVARARERLRRGQLRESVALGHQPRERRRIAAQRGLHGGGHGRAQRRVVVGVEQQVGDRGRPDPLGVAAAAAVERAPAQGVARSRAASFATSPIGAREMPRQPPGQRPARPAPSRGSRPGRNGSRSSDRPRSRGSAGQRGQGARGRRRAPARSRRRCRTG